MPKLGEKVFTYIRHTWTFAADLDFLAWMNEPLTKQELRICIVCRKFGHPPKACTRCKAAVYCSRECQKEDFPQHKKCCRQIHKLQTTMQELEEPLHSFENWSGGREDIFEHHIGHFWGLLDPRDYCRARFELADFICMYAYDKPKINLFAVDVALGHMMELLRFSHSDNQGVRSFVPCMLVLLGRWQDCYDFIKWWSTRPDDYDWGDAPQYDEGEWVYPKGKDMQENIFDDPEVMPAKYFDACHLLVLILLKMLLLDRHKQSQKLVYAFTMGTHERLGASSPVLKLSGSDAVLSKIASFVQPNFSYRSQELILQDYLSKLDKSNPRIMRAVANPDPLLSQDQPQCTSRGTAEEAHHALLCCLQGFLHTGMQKKVQELYGEKPSYDYEMSLLDYW